MKKQKRDGGGGLQDWLSYQARTRREPVRPETDVIDWDEGIEVQEEWLPRELCEQRLREEAERLIPEAVSIQSPVPVASDTPVIELPDVALQEIEAAALPAELPVCAQESHESRHLVAAEPVAAPARDILPREVVVRIIEPKTTSLLVGIDVGMTEVALQA